MSLAQVTTLLRLGDRIFLSALIGQSVILIILGFSLLGFKPYFEEIGQRNIIHEVVKEWEASITEYAYLQQMVGPEEMEEGPILLNFEKALRANGISLKARLVECSNQEDLIHLSVGKQPLKKCLQLKRDRSSLLMAAMMGLGIILGSMLLVMARWYFSRKKMDRLFYEPLLSTLKSEAHATAVGKITRQLAHDIRSPLATLTALMENAQKSSSTDMALLQQAAERIRQIAQGLMSDTPDEGENLLSRVELGALLKELIQEKIVEYQSRSKISLILTLPEETVYTLASSAILKRMVSNLINNAFEAMEERQGTITVSLIQDKSQATISIRDMGQGIAPANLKRLGEQGFTTKHGRGLGLSHTKTWVEKWGGSFHVSSTLNIGTEIKLTLVSSSLSHKIVLLDDSPLTHQTWRPAAHRLGLEMKSFMSQEEMTTQLTHIPKDAWIFIDQDLQNSLKGVEVARELIEQGFHHVFICTGSLPGEIDLPVGSKGQIDKSFPLRFFVSG